MPLSKPGEKPRAKLPVVVSQGEPSGIGPEVAVKAWSLLEGSIRDRPIHLIGNADVFAKAAAFSKLDAHALEPAIIDIGGSIRAEPSRPSQDNAEAVTSAIARCVDACLSGKAAAMVTAPIHKSV